MSSDCDKWGEHSIDCDENFFGRKLIITGKVVCKDGSKFEDYTLEEHLYFLFGIKMEWENKEGFCKICQNELIACVCMGDD